MDANTRDLVIEPLCGLCNRLLAIAFAQRLADLDERRLVVMWANNHPSQASHLNCELDDLFESDLPRLASFDGIEPARLVRLIDNPSHMPWTRVDVPGAVALDRDRVDLAAYRAVPIVGITAFSSLLARGDDPDLAVGAAATFLLRLRPVRAIESAVKAFKDTYFRGPVLGVHVRRGDHGAMLAGMGIAQPTEDDFLACVDACLSMRPALRAFCATDDPDVKARFHRHVGQRACSYPVDAFDRATPDAARAALIDLLLLSHTDFICGSPRSSFTKAATFRNLVRRGSYEACVVDVPAGSRHDPAIVSATVDRVMEGLDASSRRAPALHHQ